MWLVCHGCHVCQPLESRFVCVSPKVELADQRLRAAGIAALPSRPAGFPTSDSQAACAPLTTSASSTKPAPSPQLHDRRRSPRRRPRPHHRQSWRPGQRPRQRPSPPPPPLLPSPPPLPLQPLRLPLPQLPLARLPPRPPSPVATQAPQSLPFHSVLRATCCAMPYCCTVARFTNPARLRAGQPVGAAPGPSHRGGHHLCDVPAGGLRNAAARGTGSAATAKASLKRRKCSRTDTVACLFVPLSQETFGHAAYALLNEIAEFAASSGVVFKRSFLETTMRALCTTLCRGITRPFHATVPLCARLNGHPVGAFQGCICALGNATAIGDGAAGDC